MLWDLQKGELMKTLKGHSLAVTAVAFTSDMAYIVSGGLDRQILVWDIQAGC